MDLTLSDEQRQMQRTAREAFEARGGIEFARRQLDGDERAVTELWDLLHELGILEVTVPVAYGGIGEGMSSLGLLLEESGRYAHPGPVPETLAFAVPLIAAIGTDEQRRRLLPQIADGESMLTFALYDDEQSELPGDISMEARSVEGGFRLSGSKTLVPYGDLADRALVAARTTDGSEPGDVLLFDVDLDAVPTTRLDSLDETRPLAALRFDDHRVAESALLGPSTGCQHELDRAIDRYTVATCSMMAGAADRAVELSIDHGKTREQYGQPIGRFQSVKHRIVDMWATAEKIRELTRHAAWAISTDVDDAERAVSSAAMFCGNRSPRIFGDDIKNHGGQGFTWDHDGHIYLKRAKSLANFLREPSVHRGRLADELGF